MNNQQTTAKDFFIHLGALITLYVSVISTLSLLFAVINSAFPDALSYSYYGSADSYTIRWTISSLVILFPLYIYLARNISKDILANSQKADFWIRKWSKYLTLFLTGGAVVVDLIVLLNTFLGGEISIRFILKVLAVFLVSSFTFYAYIKNHKKINILFSIASIVVIGSIVLGFITIGSPTKQRAKEFDNRRVTDIQSLQYSIDSYADRKKSLPQKLSEISISGEGYPSIKDPETKKEYEYIVKDLDKYSICAVFSTVSVGDFWPHKAERTCFDHNAIIN